MIIPLKKHCPLLLYRVATEFLHANDILEENFQRELNSSGVSRSGRDQTGIAYSGCRAVIGGRYSRHPKVRMVQNIEEVHSKLNLACFAKGLNCGVLG